MLLIHGWFLLSGNRINLNPENGLPFVYRNEGFWLYHGSIFFKEEFEFEGSMHDHCGISEVRGTLRDGKLAFNKCYLKRPDTIRYELVQTVVPEEFVGTYTGTLVGTGKTKLSATEPTRTLFVE